MDSALTYPASDDVAARDWASSQLSSWGITTPYIGLWLNEASSRLRPEGTARVVLDYDPKERLLSLDVWCDGLRVYGMDDLL